MIKPTVGRVVWFWAEAESSFEEKQDQPYAAFVTYVHPDGSVNLAFFDSYGEPDTALEVDLIQEENDRPVIGTIPFAEWMPYQIGQAKTQTQVLG